MVLRQHGHRDHIHLAQHATLQWPMAILALGCCIRAKCLIIRDLLHFVHSAIRSLPAHFHGHDQASGSIDVHRDLSHGLRNYHQHVRLRLRSGVGRVGPEFRLGYVDF
jgi:hypothetical protein